MIDIQQDFISQERIDEIILDKYSFIFNPWDENHKYDTYGGKLILNYKNEPLFAELVILRLLEEQGYKGVWVDTYRNKFWQRLPHFSFPVIPDNKILEIYNKIYSIKGGRKSGCFDIIAYDKNENFIFCELKKSKEDKIRNTQIEWLKAALTLNLKNAYFIIAEWSI